MLFLVKDIVKTNQLLNLVKLQNNDCEMTTGTIYKMKLIQGVFFSGSILRGHCVQTINAIDLRFFALYCGNRANLFGTKNTNLLQKIR